MDLDLAFDFTNDESNKLSKENILKLVSPYEIINFFYKNVRGGDDLKLKTLYSSPFREESNNSFNIYPTNNSICFMDYGNGYRGNCFDFVMKLYNLEFYDSLKAINSEMGLMLGSTGSPKLNKKPVYIPKPELNIKKHFSYQERKWEKYDRTYWNVYGIDIFTLKRFNVKPIEYYSGMKNNRIYFVCNSDQEPIYAYMINDSIRFYRPLSINRFSGNKDKDDIFGLDQLNDNCVLSNNNLIITGGEKDVLSLSSNGYNSICFNSENSIPNENIMNILISRFKNIYFMYDNDDIGIEKSYEFACMYGCNYIVLDEEIVGSDMDISDVFKNFGKSYTINLLKSLL